MGPRGDPRSRLLAPMLAHDASSHKGSKLGSKSPKITFPCLAQPKLDGVRMLAARDASGLHLWSRTAKTTFDGDDVFGGMGRELSRAFGVGESLGMPRVILDGEVYLHGRSFEELVSMFKNQSGELEYHAFDLIDLENPNRPAEERQAMLAKLLSHVRIKPGSRARLKQVRCAVLQSEASFKRCLDRYIKAGYEGIMLRRPDGAYQAGKRSWNLIKIKPFQTEEYAIVGVEEATGKDRGAALFVCSTETPKNPRADTFRVMLKAPRSKRREYWTLFLQRPDALIGKLLTVRFQELTANGIPRFPIGLAIRDYE